MRGYINSNWKEGYKVLLFLQLPPHFQNKISFSNKHFHHWFLIVLKCSSSLLHFLGNTKFTDFRMLGPWKSEKGVIKGTKNRTLTWSLKENNFAFNRNSKEGWVIVTAADLFSSPSFMTVKQPTLNGVALICYFLLVLSSP